MKVLANALLVSLATNIPFKKFNIKSFLMCFVLVTILFTFFDNVRLLNENKVIKESFDNIDWMTNTGECPMDKIVLKKKPGSDELVLQWKRKDKDTDGEPKTFRNKQHFDDWWNNFILENLPSIQSCQVEIPVTTPAVLEQAVTTQQANNTQETLQTVTETSLQTPQSSQTTTTESVIPLPRNLQAIDTQKNDSLLEKKYLDAKLKRRKRIYNAFKNKKLIHLENKNKDSKQLENEKNEIEYLEKELQKRNKIYTDFQNKRNQENNPIMISDDMDVERVIDTTDTDIPKPFELNNNIISDTEDEYVDLFRKQIEILKVDEDKQKKDLSHYLRYGYSFMPPEYWNVPQMRTPVCVTEKRCPVCPMFTETNPVNYMTDEIWRNAVVEN